VPLADICGAASFSLFDHLVGAREQRCWDFEAERSRSLEIDHQLVLGRRLHRQVGGLLVAQDAVDVNSRMPILVALIGAIGDQAADLDEVAERIDRGQLVPSR
jgi:hypothetical protein